LFRAISKDVALTEEHHVMVRSLAVKTIQDGRFQQGFSTLIGKNVDEYLEDSKMLEDEVWGTGVDIFALATLLQTPISVYYQASRNRDPQWYQYRPLKPNSHGFVTEVLDTATPCIYLWNGGNHFDRVLNVQVQ